MWLVNQPSHLAKHMHNQIHILGMPDLLAGVVVCQQQAGCASAHKGNLTTHVFANGLGNRKNHVCVLVVAVHITP